MKLFYAPGACSLGIHVLLEEIGKPYEAQKVNLREGEHLTPEFKAINPKAKVPVLALDDGGILTEWLAIAGYLAASNPEAKLVPEDRLDWARATELMSYINSTMHMQGFTRIFRPSNFAPNAADEDAVKARGREIFERGLGVLDHVLSGKDYVVGQFSIADAALFYVEFWAAARLKMDLPSNVAAHYQRMAARPAVQRTLQQEGLAV